MLVQLFKDNYTSTPVERLNFTVYNGYFNGTDANTNLQFFNTAEVLATGSTTNLSSLATATNGQFQENPTDTEAMNDDWDMVGYTYTPNPTLTITTRGTNNMRLTTTGFDPQLALGGESRPTINSANFKYIHLRCKIVSVQAGTTVDELQLFYFNSTGQGIDGARRLVYPYGNYTLGQWINIVFDMTNIPNWTIANWNQYRLDPIRDGNCVIDFDYFIISNSPIPPDYNNKSVKISGFFRAKKTGTYRFYTRSDDASFLVLDNALTVSNGGIHSAQNKFGNRNLVAGNYYRFDIYYGDYKAGHEFSAGYLEPNNDGTTSGSTNTNDFIKNFTNLTTFYDINPETQPTEVSSSYPLVLEDDTLQGLFRVSPLALYFNRPNFSISKHDILYIASDDLFNSFNGTYKNYIQIHEKPVDNEIERKRFTQFSSDMSFICELNGRIEVNFRRGAFEPSAWRYVMLILDVERIPEKKL